jgi:hypothetical protein
MARLIKAGQTDAAKRRVFFDLRETDGVTTAEGEEGGQPVRSTSSGYTEDGIGTLVYMGRGTYYAIVDTEILTAGALYETRYKSDNTAECPGDSLQVVAFDPDDAETLGLAIPEAVNALLEEEHGTGTWGASLGNGDHAITFQLLDNLSAVVPNIPITVKNSDGTTVIVGPLPTNSEGQLAVNLNSGEYLVLVRSNIYYEPLSVYELTVAGDDTVELVLTKVSATGSSTVTSLPPQVNRPWR